jgi:uncharacterized membrane protein YfcA
MMLAWTLAALCLAAFAAGAVNSLAGGGTLLTFPTLLGAPLPEFGAAQWNVIANATSTVALVPGSVAGTLGYRRELRGAGPWLALLLAPSLLGGLVGSLLLVWLDPKTFTFLIPWLLLTAALLFLVQPALARRLPKRPEDVHPPAWLRAALVVFQFLVSVYGGYFGAGIGILMLSSLSFMGIGDVHRVNAVKTILAVAINGVSVVVFVLDGKVVWVYAVPMAAAAVLGGYAGAAVGRRLPTALVRWFVIAVGLGLAAYYFFRQAVGGSG